MEDLFRVYFDKENNVEVHCYPQFSDFHFLNRDENYQFKTYRIGRLNNFSISDLLKFWEKNNLKLGDIDTINKVSINIMYHDFDRALRILPPCVVDEKDLEKIYVDIYSSKMGLMALDKNSIGQIASDYFSYIDYADFKRNNDISRKEKFIKFFGEDFMIRQNIDNFVTVAENPKPFREVGKYRPLIVDSNKNLKQENIYNRKLLQKEIDFINSLRKVESEK